MGMAIRGTPMAASMRRLLYKKGIGDSRHRFPSSLMWALLVALTMWAVTWGPLTARWLNQDSHAVASSCHFLHRITFQCGRATPRSLAPQAVLLSDGDLGSRLHAICTAGALARAMDLRLQIVWRSDQWLPATRFSELFDNPELRVVEDLEGAQQLGEGWRPWRQVADLYIEECQGGGPPPQPPDWYRQLEPPKGLHVGPETYTCQLRVPAVGAEASCQLAVEVRRCYQQLEPAPGVLGMLVGLNWTLVRASRGVLLQAGDPPEMPQAHLAACFLPPPPPPAKNEWLQRVLRKHEGSGLGLAEELKARLRRGEIPSLKQGAHRAYSAGRRRLAQVGPTQEAEEEPAQVGGTGSRSESSGAGAEPRRGGDAQAAEKVVAKVQTQAGEEAAGGRGAREGGAEAADGEDSVLAESGIEIALDEKEELASPGGQDSLAARGGDAVEQVPAEEEEGGEAAGWTGALREERCAGGSGSWRDDVNQTLMALVEDVLRAPRSRFFLGGSPLQAVDWLRARVHPDGMPEMLGFGADSLQVLCRGSLPYQGGLPSWGPEHVHATGEVRAPLVMCARRQLAELLMLEQTHSLLHLFPSGASEFILARAAGRAGSSFLPDPPLCQRPRLQPFFTQMWTQFVDVDVRLGLLYCAMPKIACTTFRTWMRRIRGLPDLDEPEHVHDRRSNGLTVLHFHYTESQIIHILTNPGMFRFTFVRNPWNRVLSGYLDKHVLGGVVERDRHLWNYRFFGKLGESVPGPETDGLISFHNFVPKVGKVIREHRGEVDHHIAPQVDLCAFDRIKYDFVGRFENLANDTLRLGQLLQLKEKGLPLPDLGRSAHSTQSEKKLRENFDAETVLNVRRAYQMDMDFPVNSIRFLPPPVLAKLARSASRR